MKLLATLSLLIVALVMVVPFAARSDDGDVVLARGATDASTTPSIAEGTAAALEEGRAVFRRERGDEFIAQFPNERLEHFARPEQLQLYQDGGRFDDVFVAGDAAFEFAADTALGARSTPSPVHDGDLGGADGSSCRGCHFASGPDGSGSSTQRALFRGDGRHVSSAVVRDAPHVMGLGYIARIAREMEAELAVTQTEAADLASTTAVPVNVPLVAKGVSFGFLVARPGGVVDTSFVEGVSPDLVIRPFGRKGRHADLTHLVDEALQLDHGLQSASRLRDFAGRPSVIGSGSVDDPDGDGVAASLLLQDGQPGAEVSYAQATLLASYLSLLGVPEIHPPQRADVLVAWTRGRELLDATGCTLCHVERLAMNSDVVEVHAAGGYDLTMSFALGSAGQQPRAVRTDDGPGGEPGGRVPLFAYTDLKRHDLGPGLADDVDEVLPDGSDVIPGSVWLTRSLWGLADTAPYLHDGRAATVDEAIALHAGEAAGMRDAYLALSDDDRAALRVFLLSLTRKPAVLVE